MKNKLITLLVIITMLIAILPVKVFAEYTGIDTDITIGESDTDNSKTEEMIDSFLGVFQVVGTVISVISIIIIGMRYMLSSVEEKAALKGVLGYWLVGAILVFSTVNIAKFAYDILAGLGE